MTAGRAGGRAAVVGAGIAGLSVAWFLQEEGFQVTVYDARRGWRTSVHNPPQAGRLPPATRPATWLRDEEARLHADQTWTKSRINSPSSQLGVLGTYRLCEP